MARVYNEEAIDTAYEFIQDNAAWFKKNPHSDEDIRGIITLIAFLRYTAGQNIANLAQEHTSNSSDNDSLAEFLLTEKLDVVIDKIESKLPELAGVFGKLIPTSKKHIDKSVLKLMDKYGEGWASEIANFRVDDANEYFTELVYELYTSKIGKGNNPPVVQVDHHLEEFMTSPLFMPYRENTRVYNPFSGLGEFLINMNEYEQCVGVESNSTAFALSKLLLFVNKAKNSVVQQRDVLQHMADENLKGKFDYVVCRPPFNLKLDKSNYPNVRLGDFHDLRIPHSLIIEHCLNAINEQGRAILLLPHDFLNSTAKKARLFRKYLVENRLIEWVVSLSPNYLLDTNIATTVLVLSKANKDDKVNMIDLSVKGRYVGDDFWAKLKESLQTDEPWVCSIPRDNIDINDYNLVPSLYTVQGDINRDLADDYELVSLKELINLNKGSKRFDEWGSDGILVNTSALSRDFLTAITNFSALEGNHWEALDKAHIRRLEPNSLLIAQSGVNSYATLYNEKGSTVYYDSRNIFSFSINTDRIEEDYLIAELHKDYVKLQRQCFLTGVGIQKISKEDLLKIRVKVPTVEKQKRDVKSYIKHELNKQTGGVAKLRKLHKEDLNNKQHKFAAPLRQAKSIVKHLIAAVSQQDRALRENDYVVEGHPATVGASLQSLKHALEDIGLFVENIAADVEFNKSETISINPLLEQLVDEVAIGKSFKITYDDRDIKGVDVKIDFSREDFKNNVFLNIIENAEKHGFTQNNKEYEVLIRASYDNDSKKLHLWFENNGMPLLDGVKEKFRLRGYHAGKTGNMGIGGNEITETVEHFGGKVEIHDVPSAKYPVKIELILNAKIDTE